MCQIAQPPDNESIDCHLQVLGMGTLLCRAARQTGSGGTNEVTPTICANCEAGRIYREVGCDAVSPKIRIAYYAGGAQAHIEHLFCGTRKRYTDINQCKECGLAMAETTRNVLTRTRGLFTSHRFYSAYQDIEKAREAIRDGNLENAVTRSISCVESTMKACHEKLGQSLPASMDITGLWKSTRRLLDFDGLDPSGSVTQLVNVLAGVMTSLGSLRNSLSDAHGKGLFPPAISENIAELAMNTACTLSTAIVRRYSELTEEPNESGGDTDPAATG